MRRPALVFAGQGAQAVGMGADLYSAYPEVRQTFAEAEEATGLPLRRICFEGPAQELDRTEVTQPALLTVDVAIWRVVRGSLPEPLLTAGLSLGEYAALVASGALEFGEAVALVRRRGRYMQEAVPEGEGGMVAVLGLEAEAVEEACRAAGGPGEVEVANYNCPGQLVVSGRRPALERVAEELKRRGARRLVPLPVSAPFHSSLLAPAAARLAEDLEAVRFAPPRPPVVANLTARPVAEAEPWRELLAAQVDHPVRWEESLRAMAAAGADGVVELGPGKALAGFARRTLPDLEVRSIGDAASVAAVLEAAMGGLLT